MKQKNFLRRVVALSVMTLTLLLHAGMAKAQTPYAVWCESNTTLYFTYTTDVLVAGGTYDGKTITSIWSGTNVTDTGENTPGWHSCTPTTVVFDESFSIIRPTSCYQWFHDFSNLQTITGFENLNTSSVTTMHEMFEECSSLTSLDLSHFDTSNVTDMWDMFKNCDALTTLDVSSFNTSNVTNMWATFYSCDNLESIILGENFRTHNVTVMESMFGACPKLKGLNLQNFDTSKVERMFGMFAGDAALLALNVSSFNTRNVTDMYGMFALCDNLKSITFGPDFVTTNVQDVGAMFAGSYSLQSLDLSTFDTSNVRSFSGEPIVYYHSLEETDFDDSSFPASSFGMFSNCTSLKTIYCKNDWSTSTATNDYMFFNCQSLVGGLGTEFSSSIIDNSYARPDVPGTSGYFTVPLIAQAIWTAGNKTVTFVAMPEEDKIEVGDTFNGQQVTSVWSGIDVIGTGEFAISETIPIPGWASNELEKVVFDPSFQYVHPKTCAGWFSECYNLTTIEGIENLNTCETLDMKYMFRFCTSLTSLDLHTLDTSNVIAINQLVADCYALRYLNIDINTSKVTDMSGLFAFCQNLQSLTFSPRFDTSKVTNMVGMFAGCQSLTYLDLSTFDTSNVTDMSAMFAGCTGLTSLNLNGFDVSKVTSFHAEGTYFGTYMSNGFFTGCTNLTTIYCDKDWKTASLVPAADFGKSLFDGCVNLVGGLGTVFDSNKVDMDYAHPDTPGNPGYFTVPYVAQAIWTPGNTTLTFIASKDEPITVGSTFRGYEVAAVWSGTDVTNSTGPWTGTVSETLTTVVFDESFAIVLPQSLSNWFRACYNLSSLVDIENLNTSEVTDMSFMFYMPEDPLKVSQLTTLDVTHFITNKVTDMRSTFNGLEHLASIDVSSFNTSNVTSMRCLFNRCKALTSLDVSNFDTSNVTSMVSMFNSCSSLTSLDVSKFDTSNVTDMQTMFSQCSALTSLDMSGFDTRNVVCMLGMFAFCSSLTSLDVSDFNTQNVKDMYGMFALCDRLQSINFGPNFTTSLVEDMGAMFAASFSLQTLDLSTFDTSSVRSFQGNPIIDYNDPDKGDINTTGYAISDLGMFSNCMSLTTIFCHKTDHNDWYREGVPSDVMFYNCLNLVGGYGTEFDASHMDLEYARPDADGIPGYFTLDTEVITGNKPGDKDTYWTTYYYSPTTTYVAPADGQEVSVYIAKMEEVGGVRQLTLTKVEDGNIKAGQGVILESNQQNITMKHSVKRKATDDSFEGNDLMGFDFTTAVPTDEGTIYTMGNVNGELGFYKLKNTVTTLKGRKAYLAIPEGGDAPLRFVFDGTATGIGQIANGEMRNDDVFYNLAGQRVANPTKGIYIVNGKKVFVK